MKPAAAKRVREALNLLVAVGLPKGQQNERSALTLLALAEIQPRTSWENATAPLRGIKYLMDWMSDHYEVHYAPNTRETIRRQTLHQFVEHGLVVENPDRLDRPINSPDWCYQLAPATLKFLQVVGSAVFKPELAEFLKSPAIGALQARHRDLPREPVRLPDGATLELSAGGQNTLIRDIVEAFVPKIRCISKVLLLGDAANKGLISDPVALAALGILIPPRGKAPDVLVHDESRNWLIIVEAVTSHGPVDQKRKNEMERLFASSHAGLVFVSAFPDRKVFTRRLAEIAWETEVWIADTPDHMVHFNGERFLGPY